MKKNFFLNSGIFFNFSRNSKFLEFKALFSKNYDFRLQYKNSESKKDKKRKTRAFDHSLENIRSKTQKNSAFSFGNWFFVNNEKKK